MKNLLFVEMVKAKNKPQSPAVKKAASIKKKYKNRSPGKAVRCRRAILAIENKEVTIRKASQIYDLSYSYLQRRLSGEVEIDSRNGPKPVFNKSEEEAMAHWLQEMANRGMGLKPAEFLDFIQNIVTTEKKQTKFTNNRPGYDWYYAFMKRNAHIVEIRTETPLETCRAKLTKEKTDKWYASFKNFLLSKGLIDKPNRIWNADETGFSMGSVSGKVIGPIRESHPSQVPHLSGGNSKQRLTVMFCGSADGTMMPPYLVYPEPKPRGYNPLTGALYGSDIAYTKKGWMDSSTFEKFLDHFHLYAGTDRPVVLLIDSVSSHISMSAFEQASNKGIELYRLVPNATHLMQPLDVGVFGPLKQRWHQVVRAHTRSSPDAPIGKHNFAEKLKEAFLLFYKPLTVINAFRSSGIFPVDGTVISKEQVKPGITFGGLESGTEQPNTECSSDEPVAGPSSQETSGSSLALQALESALTTPTKEKYAKRLQEGYDIQGVSPCFDVYKKLVSKTTGLPDTSERLTSESVVIEELESECGKTEKSKDLGTKENQSVSGLNLLATAAFTCSPMSKTQDEIISPIIKEALTFPSISQKKNKARSKLEHLPDNLTSAESLRAMSLKSLIKIRAFREREIKAKKKYMLQSLKEKRKSSTKHHKALKVTKTSRQSNKGKAVEKELSKSKKSKNGKGDGSDEMEDSENVSCMFCKLTWAEDEELKSERSWVQCDLCDQWLHADCSEIPVVTDDDFYCDKCEF